MPHVERNIFHYLLHKNVLSEFYLMMGIRNFGLSMISIFISSYIYSLQNSIVDVIVFLLINFIVMSIFFPVAAKLTSKIGTVHTILFSVPLTVSFFYFLNYFSSIENFIFFAGIIFGISEAFFWMAFNEEFSFISKTKKTSFELGITKIFITLAAVIGPFVGGVIILFTGFDYLFLIVIALIFIGTLPLLFSKDIKPKQKYKFSFKKIYKSIHNPLFFALAAQGTAHMSMIYLWPLFVFLIVSNYFELGLLSLISNIFYVLVIFLVIFRKSFFEKIKLFKFGNILFGLTLMIRGLSQTFFHIMGAWVLGAIFLPLIEIPFDSKAFQTSKKLNKPEFFVMREHALVFGRIFLLLVLFSFLHLGVTTALTISLTISGILVAIFWKI